MPTLHPQIPSFPSAARHTRPISRDTGPPISIIPAPSPSFSIPSPSYPPPSYPSFPRKRESTPRSAPPPPSFRRRPESRTPAYPAGRQFGVWIPAFAGMTNRNSRNDGDGRRQECPSDSRQSPATVIPAPAGIQNPGASPAYRHPPRRHSGAGRNPAPRRIPGRPPTARHHSGAGRNPEPRHIPGLSPPPPRRHSGAGRNPEPRRIPGRPLPATVIPAQAGIQNPGAPRTAANSGRGFPLSRE